MTETITLSRDQLTSALREAAAQGMDCTSGPSCGDAASCRKVADEIVAEIDAGRFSPDTYVYAFADEQKARQRAAS